MSKVAGFMRERLKSPTVFIIHVLAEIWGGAAFSLNHARYLSFTV